MFKKLTKVKKILDIKTALAQNLHLCENGKTWTQNKIQTKINNVSNISHRLKIPVTFFVIEKFVNKGEEFYEKK